jgi:hypothetical protein
MRITWAEAWREGKGFMAMPIEVERVCEGGAKLHVFVRSGIADLTPCSSVSEGLTVTIVVSFHGALLYYMI